MNKFIIIVVGAVILFFVAKWFLRQVKGTPDQPDAYWRHISK